MEQLDKLIDQLEFVPELATKSAEISHGVEYHNLVRKDKKTKDLESSDYESLKFLYTLVDTIKPKIMIETGSYYGVTAAILATLLKDNQRLYTVEYASHKKRHIRKNCKTLNVLDKVEILIDDSTTIDWEAALDGQLADFAFIDCEYRAEAAEHVVPHLKSDSFLMVHDMGAYRKEFSPGFAPLIKKGILRGPTYLPIGRGFWLFGVN